MLAQKITYNIIVNGVAKVFSIALALFGIGLLSRYLGTDGFGKYTIMLTFFAFFSAIGDFGLYSIATREISRDGAKENWILSRIFTLRLLISSIIFICATSFVWFLPYDPDVKTAILIAAGAFIFSSSYGLLNGLFQKHLAMDKVALVELSGKVVQVIILFTIVQLRLNFVAVALALFISMFWNFIFIFLISRKFTKITFCIDKSYWKSFIKESAPMGISVFVTFLYFKIDTILLSFFTTSSDVGIYGAAYKIIETLIFFPAMVIGLIFPLFSRYIFTNPKIFIKIANIILKLFILITIPLVITTFFLAPHIIAIVNGPEFNNSILVLQILIFALASIFFGHLFTNILIASSQQTKLMIALIAAAVINIVANIIFIPLYSYVGAAVVSVTTELFVVITTIIIALRYTPYKFISIKLPFILLAGVTMIVLCLTLSFAPFITATISVITYGILLFVFRVIRRDDIIQILPKRI